jgi:uncharacterized protein (DUF2132 family)
MCSVHHFMTLPGALSCRALYVSLHDVYYREKCVDRCTIACFYWSCSISSNQQVPATQWQLPRWEPETVDM